MGASVHKLSKSMAIGGKPPYLRPYFGMFGYGGPVASMHLGRRTRVSSKTKHVKGVDINKLQCRLKDIYFPYIQVKTCL
ncbi:unnamed protein product [Lathyrus oleraceus]